MENIEYCESINYYKNQKSNILTAEEEKVLIMQSSTNKQARDKLVQSNIPFIVSIAKKYKNNNVTLDDIIQEGIIGLLIAIDRFDISNECRLLTYAGPYIKKSIINFLSANRTLKVDTNLYFKMRKYVRLKELYKEKYRRTPSDSEMAKELDVTISKIKDIEKALVGFVSINDKIREECDEELEEIIPSNSDLVEDTVIESTLKAEVEKLFEEVGLSERQKDVLIKHCGLDGNNRKTFLEISKILNISKSRVEQLESQAIKKIRKSKQIDDLAIYLDDPIQAAKNLSDYRKFYILSKNKTRKIKNLEKLKSKI